jgi:pimeloyl-ACP methyl ester carboxylesterase
MDSPDQGQTGLPLTSVQVKEDTLVLEAAYMNLRIALPLSGGDERRAVMEQNGVRSEIVMRRGTSESALRRPQEPRGPLPYLQREVVFQSRAQGIRLGGTLTLPTGPGPHPAVVFISGSGAQDRDETVAGHQPFLVLGDHLTRLGYAVLRTDDRGVGASTGNVLHSDISDIADDVRAGIDYLRGVPEIDAGRIGLLGHSEGGYVAPIVAASDDRVAFVLLLGAPALGGRELMLAQRAALTRASGVSPEHVRLDSMMIAEIFAVLAERPPDDRIGATVDSALSAWLLMLGEEERSHVSSQLSARTAAADSQSVGLWRSSWFKGLFHYDPADDLQKMTVPVFALIGELDLQVPAAQNAERFRALYRGPRQQLLSLNTPSGINHMLQPASTGSMEEYMAIEVTIAPVVLQLMEEWLGRIVPLRRASH